MKQSIQYLSSINRFLLDFVDAAQKVVIGAYQIQVIRIAATLYNLVFICHASSVNRSLLLFGLKAKVLAGIIITYRY